MDELENPLVIFAGTGRFGRQGSGKELCCFNCNFLLALSREHRARGISRALEREGRTY